MYITYCRHQKSLNEVDTTEHRLNATAGDYRPTYLMRVSDWKKVPGHEAKKGYCALSYVWAQSGDVVQTKNGEYDCIDNGQHCIVEGYSYYDMDNNKNNDIYTRFKKRLFGNKRDSITMVPTEKKEGSEKDEEYTVQFLPSTKSKATIKYVTYEKFLQQLCNDFQIEYLWYDKRCIDQSNEKIKYQEIKQMHRIYGNACYTVAFVPEVHVSDPNAFDMLNPVYGDTQVAVEALGDMSQKSLWWKRSWTLEETMVSKRLLLIGTNTYNFYTCDTPVTRYEFPTWMLDFVNRKQGGEEGGSVNQALNQAHFRTSSKEHDKIFSLMNIFHDMFGGIEINYKMDIKDIFNTFYRTITTNDLSILCFGSNFFLSGLEYRANKMRSHHLPSWTGVSGRHLSDAISTTTTWLQQQHFISDDMLLHITTKYYKTLLIKPYNHGHFSPLSHDNQLLNQHIAMFNKRHDAVDLYHIVEENTALLDWAVKMRNVSSFNATHYYQPQGASIMETRPISLTEDCKECIILPILFKSYNLLVKSVEGSHKLSLPDGYSHDYYLPVFRKCMNDTNTITTTQERYKAIGIYYLGDPNNGDLSSSDPDEILKTIFEQKAIHDIKEFIIE
ncbi:hypothetical protein BDA99DRAFT_510966 [Phascolomyces articulosus]|uniref:Heterokaryon incompatibility domain-containing protein n=1 Tax=Phascolomyces articulosus TaxID=60185 RepID=A0AAD5PE20_9FUNG|nr:hypothetical protein BDA99DRAFT_510966 [Phascolomyces articulosus]